MFDIPEQSESEKFRTQAKQQSQERRLDHAVLMLVQPDLRQAYALLSACSEAANYRGALMLRAEELRSMRVAVGQRLFKLQQPCASVAEAAFHIYD